jgi:AraC-like DNA-binding protein
MANMRLTAEEWIWKLLDPKNSVELELSATPILLRPQPGWFVKSGGVPEHLFYLCRAGAFTAEVDGTSFRVKAGEALWVNADTPFFFDDAIPSSTVIARFRVSILTQTGRKVALKSDSEIGRTGDSAGLWLELLQMQLFPSGPLFVSRDGPVLRTVLAGLLADTFAPGASSPLPHGLEGAERKAGIGSAQPKGLTPLQAQALQDWVHSLPPSARPTTDDLARQLHLSRDYANTLCRRTFRLSAERWIIDQRIRAAAQRLCESALTVSEVADEFGFTSLYFFSRQFRAVLGQSPKEYRERHCG